MKESLKIEIGKVILEGDLTVPNLPKGLVLFAHGSGSGRNSPRNHFVAEYLNKLGYATFLMDLFANTESELSTGDFDLKFLSERMREVTVKLKSFPFLSKLPVGLYGSSTGAAVALVAASYLPKQVHAVVCRGGRVDLATGFLGLVQAPTLLVVGGNDDYVLELNRESFELLESPKKIKVIPGAGHLFEEPGTLEEVAKETGDWFETHLSPIPKNEEIDQVN
ncbi:alpha/beta fold hydrolase [Algoriphagus sp. CAU 1675]|uniref:dienelactone hydrolase family protein n=1 Tax=Algoriphagus sp. CAU 1675 TaxID=3032597 RepID=UPI0023D98010|nr:alpha/beta fold hydrolase [Algoriphagus sp. CAU 1675]MDF2157267.1 dienelactone hydrolase family protein [Algoriphagus sp. CAU 1675]